MCAARWSATGASPHRPSAPRGEERSSDRMAGARASARLIELWLKKDRPLLGSGSTMSLFPGYRSRTRKSQILPRHLYHDHQKRCLGAYKSAPAPALRGVAVPEHHPGAYERVRRILGHRALPSRSRPTPAWRRTRPRSSSTVSCCGRTASRSLAESLPFQTQPKRILSGRP